jgi:hypothetical protein
MLFSNDRLVDTGENKALFFSSLHFKKISSQLIDLDIESPVGGCTLAKFRPSMYITF